MIETARENFERSYELNREILQRPKWFKRAQAIDEIPETKEIVWEIEAVQFAELLATIAHTIEDNKPGAPATG